MQNLIFNNSINKDDPIYSKVFLNYKICDVCYQNNIAKLEDIYNKLVKYYGDVIDKESYINYMKETYINTVDGIDFKNPIMTYYCLIYGMAIEGIDGLLTKEDYLKQALEYADKNMQYYNLLLFKYMLIDNNISIDTKEGEIIFSLFLNTFINDTNEEEYEDDTDFISESKVVLN